MATLLNIILAMSVSIDGFSIGVIYGIKGIKIPWISQLIIALSTSLSITAGMVFGKAIESFLSPSIAKFIGVIILFIMGIRSLKEAMDKDNNDLTDVPPIATFRIKSLGLAVMILREPTIADQDISGVIDPNESLFLGIALAMDAFGAGIGAAAAGFHVMTTVFLVTVMSILFLSMGLYIGSKKIPFFEKSWARFLPGSLLIALAATKAFHKG